jgi:hypothetical protein
VTENREMQAQLDAKDKEVSVPFSSARIHFWQHLISRINF